MSKELREPASRAVQVFIFGGSAVLAASLSGVPLEGQLAAGVAAGLSPAASDYLSKGLGRVRQRWRRNAEAAIEAAAQAAQLEADELLGRLTATSARQELLATAVEAAARAVLEAKVKALGRSLATGASADEKVDHELLFVRAMADIELPHLQLIQHMKDAEQRLTRSELAALSGIGSGLDPLLSTLERHGLVREEPPGRWGAVLEKDQEPGGTWAPTAFGLECLQRLRDAGYSEPDQA